MLCRSVLSNSLDPMDYSPPGLLCPWDSPGKNTEVGKPFPPLGTLPNPGIKPASLNVCLPWQVGSLPLAPLEKYLKYTLYRQWSLLAFVPMAGMVLLPVFYRWAPWGWVREACWYSQGQELEWSVSWMRTFISLNAIPLFVLLCYSKCE